MKTLIIYCTLATITIIILSVSLYRSETRLNNFKNDLKKKETSLQQKEKSIKETEEVLRQCSERYYKAIGK